MYVMTNTDKGIATIAIDGSSVGTLDTYAASEGQNVLKSLTGIAVAADGNHVLRITNATKNASASDYTLSITYIVLTRTGA